MTRAKQRRTRKLYERDFAAFRKIIRQYFRDSRNGCAKRQINAGPACMK